MIRDKADGCFFLGFTIKVGCFLKWACRLVRENLAATWGGPEVKGGQNYWSVSFAEHVACLEIFMIL